MEPRRRIEEGLPFRIFVDLRCDLEVAHYDFARLLRVSESTQYRRKSARRFEAPESDRLWRYVTLDARVVEVHDAPAATVEWMHAPGR